MRKISRHWGMAGLVLVVLGVCATYSRAQAKPFASPYTVGAPASASAERNTVPFGSVANPPFGYVSFCMRFPDQCPFGNKQAPAVPVWRYWPQIVSINQQVNRAIAPESALKHYGRAQYWNIPTDGLGDCVDYALTKRRDLARAGIPLSDLNIAIVKLPDGELHAVLAVHTSDGDYVLDNLRTAIVLWKYTGYTFLSRMSAESPSYWVTVNLLHPTELAASNGGLRQED
ncbi:MAG: transglutaminase-like cysteine peptidase [Alphaproteobacteria bacterium]|nr:transglutaminase-like cysteine peptidase [Alphaproteobacteria bacterium]